MFFQGHNTYNGTKKKMKNKLKQYIVSGVQLKVKANVTITGSFSLPFPKVNT